MKLSIGIKEENLSHVVAILNGFLADELLLYIKTRNAHWNVEGPHFHALHKFFEDQYELLDEVIDEVAERIRALGHYAQVALKGFAGEDQLRGQDGMRDNGPALLIDLLKDHESIIRKIREHINPVSNEFQDAGTSDFITGLMVTHEKMAWMLRVHTSG